jgi:hypothetical protein
VRLELNEISAKLEEIKKVSDESAIEGKINPHQRAVLEKTKNDILIIQEANANDVKISARTDPAKAANYLIYAVKKKRMRKIKVKAIGSAIPVLKEVISTFNQKLNFRGPDG